MTAAALADTLADAMAAVTASSQVTALCSDSNHSIKEGAAKSSDLRRRASEALDRHYIAEESKRRAKYAVETGYDMRAGSFLSAPLEPWTCENAPAAMLLYRRIMEAPDWTLSVSDFTGADLGHLQYLYDQQLIEWEPPELGGRIAMLSDPEYPDNRTKYPGSGLPDKRSAVGKQLRGHGFEIVKEALRNLAAGRSRLKLSRSQRDELTEWDGDTVPFALRWICWEANLVKRARPDLAEHKFLSIATCGRIVRALRDSGQLTVARPVRRWRAGRQWMTTPAAYTIGKVVCDNTPATTATASLRPEVGRMADRMGRPAVPDQGDPHHART